MSFEKEYWPGDIAEKLAGITEPARRAELENCLYNIMAICENDRNQDYWRTLYITLENICYQIETKYIFVKEWR